MEEIKKELENKFLETYEGSLGISIAAIELNGNDLKYNENLNEHPISEKWNELNLQVEKKQKFSLNWDYSLLRQQALTAKLKNVAILEGL